MELIRDIDLSLYKNPHLEYRWRVNTTGSSTDNDDVKVQVWDGGAWQDLATYDETDDGAACATADHDLTTHKDASSRIRFRTQSTWDTGDHFYIDDIRVYDVAPLVNIAKNTDGTGWALSVKEFAARLMLPQAEITAAWPVELAYV